MKAGIFALSRNEQRVVVLLIMALVAAAFFRYWRVVSTSPKPNQSAHIETAATPFPSPEEDTESD